MYSTALEEQANLIAERLTEESKNIRSSTLQASIRNIVLSELKAYWKGKIADVWTTLDVLEICATPYPDMTTEEAGEILESVHSNFDSEQGINWGVIENEAQWYMLNKETNEETWEAGL